MRRVYCDLCQEPMGTPGPWQVKVETPKGRVRVNVQASSEWADVCIHCVAYALAARAEEVMREEKVGTITSGTIPGAVTWVPAKK